MALNTQNKAFFTFMGAYTRMGGAIRVRGVSYVYGWFHTRMGQLKRAFEIFNTRMAYRGQGIRLWGRALRMGRNMHFFQI